MNQPAPHSQVLSFAPEHAAVGVNDCELGEIVELFADAQRLAAASGEQVHHLFDAPSPADIVRLNDKSSAYCRANGWMTPADARSRIDFWRERALDQGHQRNNSDKVVLSFFDKTGVWSRPWEEAGYQVYRFDIQDDPVTGDVNLFSAGFFGDWFGDFDGLEIYAILAACPCTDFAVSGARHFAAKEGSLENSEKIVR